MRKSPCHAAVGAIVGAVLCLTPPAWTGATAERTRPDAPPQETVADRILSAGLPRAAAADLSSWHTGPARYLLSGPEERLYKSLDDDQERRAFIQQFWLRRDPDVASLENEFRFAFWQRVFDANLLYTRTSEPGWKSDRGKFHVLLGPPDEVESFTMPRLPSGIDVGTSSADGTVTTQRFGALKPSESFLGLERWTYRHRPTPSLPPNFVLAFRLKDTGDYELSEKPEDFSLFYNMTSDVMRPVTTPAAADISDSNDSQTNLLELYSDVALALDLGQAQRVPRPDELLGELVTSEEFFGLIPFILQVDYYKTTGAATLAVFTIGIEGHSIGAQALTDGNVLAVGKLENLANPGHRILMTGDESLVPAPDNPDVPARPLFQMVRTLPPGEYNATFGILDKGDNNIGSYRERIRVPAFPKSGLALSTLSLARRLQPLDDVPDLDAGNAAAPFRLGHYQVVPKTDARFANGEEFTLYYQIYGARAGPRTGRLDLDVSYQFFVLTDGAFQPIGKSIVHANRTEAVQGWSFPIRDWPEATFRLEVTVTDRISGEVAVGQTVFGIGGPAPRFSALGASP